MGGSKKKSISQGEKGSKGKGTTDRKQDKKGKQNKESSQTKQPRTVMPYINESQINKVLGPMKAITLLSAAKSLGLNASVTSSLLRYLEGKKLIEKVGGYSGHYVWRVLRT